MDFVLTKLNIPYEELISLHKLLLLGIHPPNFLCPSSTHPITNERVECLQKILQSLSWCFKSEILVKV